jgi:hypothetical protein
VIRLWYGRSQHFCTHGCAQDVVNILGRARSVFGTDSLSYRLTGSPGESGAASGHPSGVARIPLPVGPTAFRLHRRCEFNIELPVDRLAPGSNHLELYHVNRLGRERTTSVEIVHGGQMTWPLPYAAALSAPACGPQFNGHPSAGLTDAVQVVDGEWLQGPDGIQPARPAYDRVVAVGDRGWSNVELAVTVQMAGWARGRRVSGYPSGGRGFGIGAGWRGHSDWHDIQPRRGYLPAGGLLWLSFTGGGSERFYVQSCAENHPLERLAETQVTFRRGCDYRIRFQFLSAKGQGLNRYRAKIWDLTETEPPAWQLDAAGLPGEHSRGSFVLVAHHTIPVLRNLETASAAG